MVDGVKDKIMNLFKTNTTNGYNKPMRVSSWNETKEIKTKQ